MLNDLQTADYGPLILQMPRDDGSMLPLPYGWCQGYAAGIELVGEARRDAWMADEHGGAILAPILSFPICQAGPWFAPPDEAARRETLGELGTNAVGLSRWWQSHLRH